MNVVIWQKIIFYHFFRGYEIPAGTMTLLIHAISNLDERFFSNPTKFIPERWIENKNDIDPFANRSFGVGPRMCIGKRFAELELHVAIHQIMNNYSVKWARSEPLDCHQELVSVPDQSLDLQFEIAK